MNCFSPQNQHIFQALLPELETYKEEQEDPDLPILFF